METSRPGETPGGEMRSSTVRTEISVDPQDTHGNPRQEKTIAGSQGSQSKAQEMAGQATDRAQQMADQARGKVDEAKHRAEEMGSQAKSKAQDALHQAESKLEQSGAVDRARENPMMALGVAFGVGFLLAGSGDEDESDGRPRRGRGRKRSRSSGVLGKAKHQITGALMGSLSAAVTQQVKTMIDRGELPTSLGEVVDTFTEQLGGGSQRSGSRSRNRGGASTAAGSRTRERSPIITDADDSMIGSRPV